MVYVSDHCVLRYCERVLGLDIEAIRAELQSPTVAKAVEIGCDTVILGSGARLKLVGDVVQTVLPKGAKDRHSTKHGVRRDHG
jgi:hypothetical protein